MCLRGGAGLGEGRGLELLHTASSFQIFQVLNYIDFLSFAFRGLSKNSGFKKCQTQKRESVLSYFPYCCCV